jgi:nucleoside-diphosphate-sugar epimerase
MKILLTGGTGFIGRYVVKEIERQGIDYVSLHRSSIKVPQAIQADLLSIENFESLFQEIRPTHLVHIAWYTEHGEYWNSDLNIKWISATKRLIEAFCLAGGQHVVIAGTCAEYDWRQGYCVEDITPLNPSSIYGISKDATRRMAELTVEKYGVSLSWARIFFPYGPGEAPQRLIPSLFKVFNGEVLPFGVNRNGYRDLLHVKDIAKAILACTQSKIAGVVNLCSGEPTKIDDIVNAVARITGSDPDIILKLAPTKREAHQFLVGANTKLQSLGWKQEIKLNEGLLNYQP